MRPLLGGHAGEPRDVALEAFAGDPAGVLLLAHGDRFAHAFRRKRLRLERSEALAQIGDLPAERHHARLVRMARARRKFRQTGDPGIGTVDTTAAIRLLTGIIALIL